MTDPKFIIYCGPMWSGKTSRMLSDLDRLKRQGKSIVAFKPTIDDRYDELKIVTHNNNTWVSNPVSTGSDLLNKVLELKDRPDVIAIDEAFMIKGVAEAAIELFRKGFTIIVASLDLSYTCEPFSEIQKMLPFATKIEKLSSVCSVTGRDAYYTFLAKNEEHQNSVSSGTDLINVGGEGKYEARCWEAHPHMNKGE